MGTLAAQVDEEALVRSAIASVPHPPGVKLRRVNVDYVDNTGDIAVQMVFGVTKKVPLTKKRLIELTRFRTAINDAVSVLHLPKWPYVNFTEVR